MNKADISLTLSIIAVAIAIWSAYNQYKQRKDMTEEKIKLELKVLSSDGGYLDPISLRMLSGVEERQQLNKLGILVTNIGFSTVRLMKVGYHDYDLPLYATFPEEDSKLLTAGQQILLALDQKTLSITNQLKGDIEFSNGDAKIFAITTKEKRFEFPAIVKVAK